MILENSNQYYLGKIVFYFNFIGNSYKLTLCDYNLFIFSKMDQTIDTIKDFRQYYFFQMDQSQKESMAQLFHNTIQKVCKKEQVHNSHEYYQITLRIQVDMMGIWSNAMSNGQAIIANISQPSFFQSEDKALQQKEEKSEKSFILKIQQQREGSMMLQKQSQSKESSPTKRKFMRKGDAHALSRKKKPQPLPQEQPRPNE